ncbi:flagellar hook-basal body protein [Lachnospiraceae bacterium OttesenSCG-928-D06]|nr:flagellar hook-basal body protein [Lachnospiraceae bacterium OttesenSCG-928-D06]
MVRSLWTAATGMRAQQINLDVIANNIANVNTTGYKTQVNEFKSLLYQNIQTRTSTANGEKKPIGAQVGLGVRNASINAIFTPGSFLESSNASDFAVDGDGFFAVKDVDGDTYYTRNGNFQWTIAANGGNMLSDSEGRPVLDSAGKAIILDASYTVSNVVITSGGEICYPDANNNASSLGVTIGLYQFNNPNGLDRLSDSLYKQSAASGQPLNEATNNAVNKSKMWQGYLEGSNVQVADEMVNMITTQRAYELNSKAITASDEMLQQANNLRR